jgi:hypothetical protein
MPERDNSAELASAEGTSAGSTDPLDHLRVIAAPEMAGRGTPSAGLDKAVDYVIGECTRAGLVGGFAEGFKQPFAIAPLRTHEDADPMPGSEPFEGGVYLSGNASPETRAAMGQSICRELAERGEACPSGALDGTLDPRSLLGHERAEHQANNILGMLPGSGPHKDDVVLLSAHLDHLGTGYPGADDNGSGSAVLIAIAHRLRARAAEHPLDRTVAFLWTTGEERGLLGSAYFTDNPPASLPLARIAQEINLDAVGALDDTRFSILPDDAAATQATVGLIDQANREMDRPFARINRDLDAYTRRVDSWSFVRHHVPSIWVFEGLTNPEGGGSLMPRYHRPTDTVENLLADNGGSKLRRMTDMLTATVEKVATAPLGP